MVADQDQHADQVQRGAGDLPDGRRVALVLEPAIITSTHTMPVPNSTSISSGLLGAALLMEFIALIACAGGSLRRPGMTTFEKARYTPALRPPPSAAATVSHRA